MVYRRHSINAKSQDSVLYCVKGTAGPVSVRAMVCDPGM